MLDKIASQLSRHPVPYYGSWASFLRTMKAFKEHGIPKRINPRSMTPILGDEAPRIGTGLTSMDWVDLNGAPSDDLKLLVGAFGTPSWKEVLSQVIHRAYSFVPGDWSELTPEQLHEAFASYVGRDVAVLKGAETFFLALALECDIPMPDKLYLRAARAHSEAKRVKGDGPEPNEEILETPVRQAPKPLQSPIVKVSDNAKRDREWVVDQIMNLTALISHKDMTPKETDAVLVLLAYLQRQGARDSKGGIS